jgi:hypothetical protein
MKHTAAWYESNLARCKAILAYLDDPTETTLSAMHEACEPKQRVLQLAPRCDAIEPLVLARQ